MSILFGFIGTGNMGGALARAAAKSTKEILLADHLADKALALAEELGVADGTNEQVVDRARYVFLGVKPQMMGAMLSTIKEPLARRRDVILVTMAAGLSIDTIRSMALGDYPVIRIMPNTPVGVGEGMVLYTRSENVSDEALAVFLDGMRCAGKLTEIPESLMDAGCSVSGCGPAFAYQFIRGLAQGGVDAGIDRQTALELAAQTVLGAARLLMESGESPDILIQKVCSPGGSTIEGVKSLENDGMEDAVRRAVTASYKRNLELGKA